MRVEKTIFISCRKTNLCLARAMYDKLRSRGYNCFLHTEVKPDTAPAYLIMNEIQSRAHFIVILTPRGLQACAQPDDWLCSEIEYAIRFQRNIIPVLFEGFDLEEVQKYMTGRIKELAAYTSVLDMQVANFDMVMARLLTQFLRKPVNVDTTPIIDSPYVSQMKNKLNDLPVVTIDQLSAEVWYERGLDSVSSIERKISAFGKAIFLNPRYVQAYNKRGNAYAQKGEIELALADYAEAIKIDPNYVTAYYSRALLYFKTSNFQAAISDYSHIIRLYPIDPHGYYHRGVVYQEIKNLDAAFNDYSEAILLEPKYADAFYNRALVYSTKQKIGGAVENFTRAININSNFREAYNNRGYEWYRIGIYKHAIADFSQAIQLSNNYADAVFNRAVAYLKTGNLDYALLDFAQTIQIEPDNEQTHYSMGVTYYRKMEYASAIQCFDQVLRLVPDHQGAKTLLAIIRQEYTPPT